MGTLGTLPRAAPPTPPLLAPWAAAINCRSFCGSLSHSLNSGPRAWAASWAASGISPVAGSAATNLTSLMRMEESLLSPRVSLICRAKSCALEPPRAKARTSRVKSSSVTLLENMMLDSPAALSNCAKLRSACPASSGTPSRRSLFSETPSRKTVSLFLGSACWSSFHVLSNWPSVRLWVTPYSRVYFTKIFRLCRNDLADALRLTSVGTALAITASSHQSVRTKIKRDRDLMHDYGGNWANDRQGADFDAKGHAPLGHGRATLESDAQSPAPPI